MQKTTTRLSSRERGNVSEVEKVAVQLDKDFVEYVKWHVRAFDEYQDATFEDFIMDSVQSLVNLDREETRMRALSFGPDNPNLTTNESKAVPVSEVLARLRV
jgi:3-dehydroquinate synthetase